MENDSFYGGSMVKLMWRLFSPIQAGVFCYTIGWGGTLCPPPFLLYLLSNFPWHDSSLR